MRFLAFALKARHWKMKIDDEKPFEAIFYSKLICRFSLAGLLKRLVVIEAFWDKKSLFLKRRRQGSIFFQTCFSKIFLGSAKYPTVPLGLVRMAYNRLGYIC